MTEEETLELLLKQFTEDRDTITTQYKNLKEMVEGSPEKLIVLGDSLVKTADLLLKQTSQVLEFVKLSKKGKKQSEGELDLSDEEKQAISEQLKQ